MASPLAALARITARRVTRALALIWSAAASVGAAPPADVAGVPTVAGREYDVSDAASGSIYRIYISVPREAPPAQGFPVFYLLDGNLQFPIAASIAPMRAYQGSLPHAVVVGIGYPESTSADVQRRRAGDYIFEIPFEKLPPNLQALHPDPGHADRFLHFLIDKVRPFVERRAPVDRACQTLFGHSLGGFFVLHTLFTRHELFQAYVAASPSVPFGEHALLREEKPFAEGLKAGPVRARLLITAGEKEPLAADAMALAERLSRLNRGLVVERQVFAGENHVSVIPASISRGIEFGLPCEKRPK